MRTFLLAAFAVATIAILAGARSNSGPVLDEGPRGRVAGGSALVQASVQAQVFGEIADASQPMGVRGVGR